MSLFSFFSSRSRHEKASDQFKPLVDKVNALEPKFSALGNEELKQKALQHQGKLPKEIEQHIPEIFAAIREASKRTTGMRHFDVQIMGGMALLQKHIAEMKTGEGKTLVATLPLITRALSGKGAHLITVNDYLAERDAEWMKPIYEFFGLTVGTIKSGQNNEEKLAAYRCDITYGTNNEFGFDYLRDNMAQSKDALVQGELFYAIVDEVDSILIDEARTPLIISAPDTESTQLYGHFATLIPSLKENTHYNIDEKRRAATLTEDGINYVEKALAIENIYEEKGIRFVHHLEQALRAHTLYHRDKDYVVQNGQVVIVDEFTGRLMEGRRYADGLHQALEAKERVAVQQESKTLASITFQNFFRLYQYLGGMTGTAVTSAEEFEKVYNLDVVVIPPNKKLIRMDKTDRIYINEKAKYNAVVEEIKERHKKGQPVLVGTIAIEKSEYLSAFLKKEGVPHEVLNAKHHAREAEIVSNAGQKGAVTISTNMAGRGTDIKLGDGVAELGGLYVLGTERHEARRIDNQLRGRSGRQGDPGETQFFVSMEDDIMRVFGGNRLQGIMKRLNVPENEPIENRLVSRALEGAQERVEGHYFDMRKQVLSYDDVMNRQRNAIYALRRAILQEAAWKEPGKESQPLHKYMPELVSEQIATLVDLHTNAQRMADWDVQEISQTIHALTNKPIDSIKSRIDSSFASSANAEDGKEAIQAAATAIMTERLQEREKEMGETIFHNLEKAASLRAIDIHWMEHLDTMDYLRTGIGLRGYGQRDPLVEYQKEGHRLFRQLMSTIKGSITEVVYKAEAIRQEEQPQGEAHHESTTAPHRITAEGKALPPAKGSAPNSTQPAATTGPLKNPYKDVGRNDLCPCGSGKKFKKCHGQ